MQYIISNVEQHGLLVVFFNLLLTQSGLPVPAVPTLVTAAALAHHVSYRLPEIIVAGVSGALLGDLVLYWCGRRYGRRGLGLLCRISFSPDFCVRQTEMVFAKVGAWSLLFAKFFPGLSALSVAMAGVTKMPLPVFLVLDAMGKLLFVSTAVALGRIFQDAIASVLATLADFGKVGVLAVAAALALFVVAKWSQRRLFIRQLRMDRITVAELRQMIDEGQNLVIVDVRPKDVREQDGIIPGAVSAHPSDIDPIVRDFPRDSEIVVYCACPNEESAATAAKHLKRAGFKRIRPLLGGIDAWVEAGEPVERAQLADDDETDDLVGTHAETVQAST